MSDNVYGRMAQAILPQALGRTAECSAPDVITSHSEVKGLEAVARVSAADASGTGGGSSSAELRLITASEVAQHNRASDCWIILDSDFPEGAFVYDVSAYLDDHPGGPEVVAKYAGEDATIMFEMAGHSDEAVAMLGDFVVGKLIA